MHRHSPLMRSLLSQSQTPTDPRRAVGFFGSGCPTGCPAKLITQSTSDWLILFEPILSIVDGGNHSPQVGRCQRPFLVQCTPLVAGLLTASAPGFRRRGVREISTVRERQKRDQQRCKATAAERFSSRRRGTAPCLGIRLPLDAQATDGKPDSIARISLTSTATSSKESSGRRSVEMVVAEERREGSARKSRTTHV